MSAFRDVLSSSVRERVGLGSGDTVTNLRTGATFVAELEAIDDAVLNTELGRDPREQMLMHVFERNLDLRINDRVSFVLDGVSKTFLVYRRSNNPQRIQVEYGIGQFVAQVDT